MFGKDVVELDNFIESAAHLIGYCEIAFTLMMERIAVEKGSYNLGQLKTMVQDDLIKKMDSKLAAGSDNMKD